MNVIVDCSDSVHVKEREVRSINPSLRMSVYKDAALWGGPGTNEAVIFTLCRKRLDNRIKYNLALSVWFTAIRTSKMVQDTLHLLYCTQHLSF